MSSPQPGSAFDLAHDGQRREQGQREGQDHAGQRRHQVLGGAVACGIKGLEVDVQRRRGLRGVRGNGRPEVALQRIHGGRGEGIGQVGQHLHPGRLGQACRLARRGWQDHDEADLTALHPGFGLGQ